MNGAKALLLIALPASVGLVSCRTTDANYRAAYEATKTSRIVAAATDDGLDENTRRLLAQDKKNRQSQQVVDGDTISIVTLFAKMEQGPTDYVPRYSVVANAFSQVFNAKALCKRLQDAGFENAYIFRTSTPDYYVAAGGSDDIADIPAIRDALARAGNPGSRAGFPAVVRCANRR